MISVGMEVRMVYPPPNEDIHKLEALDIRIRTNDVLISVDWFRAIHDYDVPNHAWHEHRSMEAHFVVSGSVTFHLPDRTVDVMGGQAILIPASMPHKLQNRSGQIYYRYVLKFTIEPVTDDPEALFMAETLDVREVRILPISGRLQDLLEDCMREAADRVSGFHMAIEISMIGILLQLSRELTNSAKATYAVREKKHIDQQRAQQIAAYIEANCASAISVPELARRVYLSPRQLQRIVQQQYGMTIREMMTRSRFKKAKDMLKDPENNISDIASSLGFASMQSFCRFFHRMEGEPPAHFRNGAMARVSHAAAEDTDSISATAEKIQ